MRNPIVAERKGRGLSSVWGILEYLSNYSRSGPEGVSPQENWEERIRESFNQICAPKEYLGFMYRSDDPLGAPYFKDNGSTYPLEMAASGEQVIIEYLARLTYPSPMNHSIILIDEPEIHLHPAWIRQLYLWLSADPTSALLSGLRSRPEWKDKAIGPPDYNAFRSGLEKNRDAWSEQMQAIQCDVVADFDEKFGLWKACQWQDDFWCHDWAGKEILHWLRIAMTSRFGWPNTESGVREALDWMMNRDRERPRIVRLRPL